MESKKKVWLVVYFKNFGTNSLFITPLIQTAYSYVMNTDSLFIRHEYRQLIHTSRIQTAYSYVTNTDCWAVMAAVMAVLQRLPKADLFTNRTTNRNE